MTRAMPDWTDGTPRLVVESCERCGRHWYFTRMRCPACGSVEVCRRISGGTGTAAAVTVLHQPIDSDGLLGVCLVDLDDGIRVMARCGTELTPGEAVAVTFAGGLPHAEPMDR